MRHSVATIIAITAAILTSACQRDEEPALAELAIPVRAEQTVAADFAPTLVLYGTVKPSLTIPLTTPAAGIISYPPRFASGLRAGERVRRGETIAFVRNEASSLDLERSRLELERAETQLARSRAGFEQGVVEKAQFDNDATSARIARASVDSLERASRRLAIAAPREGVLIVRNVFAPTSEIAGGTVLAEIAAEGHARVEAVAAASDLTRLHAGQRATFRRSKSAPQSSGRVVEVATVVDEGGTIRVIAEADSREGLPAPGEGVEVAVELQQLDGVVTVPEESVVVSGGNDSVYVVQKTTGGLGRARSVPITVGGRTDGRVAILAGVAAGDLVIVKGADLVSDGIVVKLVEDSKPR